MGILNKVIQPGRGRLGPNPRSVSQIPNSLFSHRWSLRAVSLLGVCIACCHIPPKFSVPSSQRLFSFFFYLGVPYKGPFFISARWKNLGGMARRRTPELCPQGWEESRGLPGLGLEPAVLPPSCSFWLSIRPREEVKAETQARWVWPRQAQESCWRRTGFPKWGHLLFKHWLFCLNHMDGKGFPFVKVIF